MYHDDKKNDKRPKQADTSPPPTSSLTHLVRIAGAEVAIDLASKETVNTLGCVLNIESNVAEDIADGVFVLLRRNAELVDNAAALH
jgi:hypothetical protein